MHLLKYRTIEKRILATEILTIRELINLKEKNRKFIERKKKIAEQKVARKSAEKLKKEEL